MTVLCIILVIVGAIVAMPVLYTVISTLVRGLKLQTEYAELRPLAKALDSLRDRMLELEPNRYGRQRKAHFRFFNSAVHAYNRALRDRKAGRLQASKDSVAQGLKHIDKCEEIISSGH
jgi:hypothetical protein